jgi:hypothetical protein
MSVVQASVYVRRRIRISGMTGSMLTPFASTILRLLELGSTTMQTRVETLLAL